MLDATLDALLGKVWPDAEDVGTAPEHPMHLACYKHYTELRTEDTSLVDSKTVAAWASGEDRPSCYALGRHFSKFPDKLGLLLNFAFAGLLEALANMLRMWVSPNDWSDCRRLVLDQARCMHSLDEAVGAALTRTPNMSLADFERLLSECLSDYMRFLITVPRRGVDALDLRVARFRVYDEYQDRFAMARPPSKFGEFCRCLEVLWSGTVLKSPRLDPRDVAAELAKMRMKHPDWSSALAGPLLAIEARLALCHEPPSKDSLQKAFSLYQEAFEKSRYRAGTYTARVAREALGLAALLHRRETGEGAIKPWIKKVLSWWDLLGLGAEFDHEKLEQRIELAESRFTDELNPELREGLKAALPQLGLNHWHIGGLAGFTEPALLDQLQATPVDRRQKKPLLMTKTIVGRDQTPLMEAIDRGQLGLARELVRDGADLNFVNSTGDTCVTKAFARKDYDLVLEILRRDDEPIRRETLLRVTTKMRISGFEQTLSHGRVAILSELARGKPGRREAIDMISERVWNQTPLYYAVSCIAHFRIGPEVALRLMPERMAGHVEPELFGAVREHVAKEFNEDGVLQCIRFLTNELHVNVDALHVNDNTALTLAAECRLHDVAAMLLAGGASVNHRFLGGGTALVRAIMNDDYEMAKLLLEYGADYHLFVEGLGRPIYAMPMSEKMRQLIPLRL